MAKSYGRCAVFVFLKNKSCHQVSLNKQEQEMVLGLIEQIHDGTIKITKEIYPLSLSNDDFKKG